MALINLSILAAIGLVMWWLTGFDKTAGGESKQSHYFTRLLRCGVVLLLSALFMWVVETPGSETFGMPVLIVTTMLIALVLRSSISEILTHGFLGFLDPEMHSKREFDPKKGQRYQDAIAHLIHIGKRDEAIKLCEELKVSGEVDITTLENTLEFLGVKQQRDPRNPLYEAGRLRAEGKYAEAEQLLKSMLARKPSDDGAAIMLMRLYAQDMRQPEKARMVLQALEKQPLASRDHVEFARQSINEWSRPQPPPIPAAAAEQESYTLEELIARGNFGIAIEMLEAHIRAQPGDFEAQLKLAEVFAVQCKDAIRAEKIIRKMELNTAFSQQQIELAQIKFKEWQSLRAI